MAGIESSNRVGFASLVMLLFVLLLLRTCSAASSDDVAAAPILKVANNLRDCLTVLHPPGCCSPPKCRRTLQCPAICRQCDDVVVEEGGVGMLYTSSSPDPLPYLMIQVKEKVYCVEESALELIKAWDTLAVGPGVCGPNNPYNSGLAASVSVRGAKTVHETPLCLYVCNHD